MKLPETPKGLPEGWWHDPSHKYPNGERWRSPNGGDYVDFHPGTPGKPGWGGKDHWHHNGGKRHLPPGEEIPDPEPSDSEREMCGEKCKTVFRFVRDTVTGALTVVTIVICSQSPAFN